MKFRSIAAVMAMALAVGFSIVSNDASAAKRLGAGKSVGMQRQSVTPDKSPTVAPAPAGATSAAKSSTPAAPQAQAKRSWMGPLAGLAAGLGLAALASHFGFGDELASMMMIGLIVMAVMLVIGFIMRRRNAANAQGNATANGLQYATAGVGPAQQNQAPFQRSLPPAESLATGLAGGAASAKTVEVTTASTGHIPAAFDVAGFVRSAKLNFIRLQAANDAGNLDDIREFTSPEMFAEIRLAIADRGGAKQETDVVSIDATVLDVSEEQNRHLASVRYVGLIREDTDTSPQAIDEIWHLTKAKDGNRGWVLAGIQQN